MLKTKLHRPPVTAEHVYREHLIEQLYKNQYKPFTLVSAPAGYGKSMLISSWLEKCECPYAWVSLNEDDNELHSFLNCVYHSILKIHPNSLKEFGKLIEVNELPPLRTISETLINELDAISGEFVFVFDDYHLLRNQQINELLDLLLKYPPQDMHLVILTRRDPALNLSSLRAHSRMNEIRTSDLCFRKDEIAGLFKHLLDVDLTDETIDRLRDKTEGWVTGLRLASLTVNSPKHTNLILQNLEGDIHLFIDFLVKEVLIHQPEEMRKLLLETAVLKQFSDELIDFLIRKGDKDDTPKTSGREFVEWMLKTNLFIIPLDDKNHWFRFHHLFQELLLNQLKDQKSEDDINSLHLSASKWFENQKLIDQAIQHGVAANNFNRVADIIESHGRSLMNEDKWFIVAKWLSILPDDLIQLRPELLLIKAWKHYYHFEIAELIGVLDKVDELLGGDVWMHELSGEVSCFRGFCALFMNQSTISYQFLENALSKISFSDVEFRVESELLYGIAGQIEGNAKKVEKEILEWLKAQDLHPLRETRLLLTLIFLHYMSGNIKQADHYIDKHRNVARKNELDNGVAWSDYLDGLFNLQQGNIEKAIVLMEEAATRKYSNYTLAAVDNLAALAIAYQMLGLKDKVAGTLKILEEFTAFLGQPFPYFAQSCKARISLIQGNINAAKHWIDDSQPNFNQVMIWWFEIPIITRCRVLVYEGSVENLKIAEKELIQYTDLNKSHCNQLQLITMGTLLSMVYMKQDKLDESRAKLIETIAIAEPGNFVFPFIEPGKQMIDCLKLLPDDILKSNFIQRIFLLNKEISQISHSTDEAQPKLDFRNKPTDSDSFSHRELDVLKQLAQGLRNKEIADELFISTDTVKKHLKNVFIKLDVNSRIHAINKATELGIV